jgi:hypothetical protein
MKNIPHLPESSDRDFAHGIAPDGNHLIVEVRQGETHEMALQRALEQLNRVSKGERKR